MARRCELTGKGVLTGNNVSHANNRTRRRFLPNVQEMALHSESLGRSVRLKICTKALRSVERKGGLDSFLLDSNTEFLSLRAKRIKRQVERILSTARA